MRETTTAHYRFSDLDWPKSSSSTRLCNSSNRIQILLTPLLYWLPIFSNQFTKQKRRLWQYGLWSFQARGKKLERFFHKNQHTQRKLLNFEFWINGELSKIGHHFSNKFTDRNFVAFSEYMNFTKMMPYIWQLVINPKLKIQQFPLGMLILMQKSF